MKLITTLIICLVTMFQVNCQTVSKESKMDSLEVQKLCEQLRDVEVRKTVLRIIDIFPTLEKELKEEKEKSKALYNDNQNYIKKEQERDDEKVKLKKDFENLKIENAVQHGSLKVWRGLTIGIGGIGAAILGIKFLSP